jgi:FAD synthase
VVRLRDQQRYEGIEPLVAQIRQDVVDVRAALTELPG